MKMRILALVTLLASILLVVSADADETTTPGVPETVAGITGDSGSGSDQLWLPRGVVVDNEGVLYVVDTINYRMQKIDASGNGTTIVGVNRTSGTSDIYLWEPREAAVDAAGNVYVADTRNHRIQKIDTAGVVSTVAGTTAVSGTTGGLLYQPHGVAIDGAGNLFIADTFNQRVQKVDTEGTVTTVAGTTGDSGTSASQLYNPGGIALDAAGNLYVADTYNDRVQKIDTEGTVTTVLGITRVSGTSADHLDRPSGVAVDAEGNVYISDTYNDRVQKVDTSGAVTTVVGVAGVPGSSATHLDRPFGLALGPDGSLYIADSGNQRVQKLVFDTADPLITVSEIGQSRVGDKLEARFACDDAGYGIDTCSAELDGQTIEYGDVLAAERGTHTLVVVATDLAGNTATESFVFVVAGRRELTGAYAQMGGAPGAIARLYMAAFTRDPESTGFDYWETGLGEGNSLLAIADYFVAGPEFGELYGSTTNLEFVDLMYRNAMTRDADPAGHAYWLDQLDAGMTQARVLYMFSDSAEFRSLTYTS